MVQRRDHQFPCIEPPVNEFRILVLWVPRHHWKLGQAKQLQNTGALALDQHIGPVGVPGVNFRVDSNGLSAVVRYCHHVQ